jgi:hypothetical protein
MVGYDTKASRKVVRKMVYLTYTERNDGAYEVCRGSQKIAEITKTATGCEIRTEPVQYATPEETQAMRGFLRANDEWLSRRAGKAISA